MKNLAKIHHGVNQSAELASDRIIKNNVDNLEISYYENFIPSHVGDELDCLYQNVFSSLVKLKIYGAVEGVSTYEVRRNGKIITLFLIKRDSKEVKVLNEFIKLERDDIEHFADFIFDNFHEVAYISFGAVQAIIEDMRFPYQQFHSAEDIVAQLPDTVKDYEKKIGKSLIRAINYYSKKLIQAHPSFSFKVMLPEEMDESQFLTIFHLHKSRMVCTEKVSNVNQTEMGQIIDLARQCGLVGVATIDDDICAGLICWRTGNHFFLRTIAHDPKFDRFSLGKICCYRMICECIRMGGKHFHFLWGRNLYKSRFLGVEQDFDRFVIYRSSLHMLCAGKIALTFALTGTIRNIRLWLLNAEKQEEPKHRIAIMMVQVFRKIKGFLK